jgi:small conductance mechanosensitive channel
MWEKIIEPIIDNIKTNVVDNWDEFAVDFIFSILIIILTLIALGIANRIIERAFDNARHMNKIKGININDDEASLKRLETLKIATKSITKMIIVVIGSITVLGQFVDITGMLAVAGVGSIVIGLGAQSLISDIVAGFSIIYENHFAVGDYVTINNVSGFIEEISIRSTKYLDFNGDLHIINNSSINFCTNHSRSDNRSDFLVGIAYEEDVDRAMEIMKEECKTVYESEKELWLKEPIVLGIEGLDASAVNVKIGVFTNPVDGFAGRSLMQSAIKKRMENEGIEISYNKLVLYKGEEAVENG